MKALDILSYKIQNKIYPEDCDLAILGKSVSVEDFLMQQEGKKPWHKSDHHAPKVILNNISDSKKKKDIQLFELKDKKIEGQDSEILIISENDYGSKFYYYEVI